MTRVTAAVVTYNGAAYVAEQLASIARQTRPPEEIVVVDDGSTDRTVAIVERSLSAFRGNARVLTNPSRLGVVANVSRALGASTGDLIAVADQDDVWEEHKLDRLTARLDAEPEAGGVFSNGRITDAAGEPTGQTLWQNVGFSPSEQSIWMGGDPLAVLLRHEVVTGATSMFRRTSLEPLLPLPALNGGLHDSWLALQLALRGRLIFETQPLIRYRLHGRNMAGLHAGGLRAHLRQGRMALEQAGARAHFLRLAAAAADDAGVDAAGPDRLRDAASHLEARTAERGSQLRRLLPLLRELRSGRYSTYSDGWRTAVWDALVPRGPF